MPRFLNATGYLIELRNTINLPWFSAICDMALESTGETTSPTQLQNLWNYLHNTQAYASTTVLPTTVSQAPTSTTFPNAFLHELLDFDSFKKLSPTLHVKFNKPVTLIFGKNGAGKSSLCQAFKVLANPESPKEPLNNVRATGPVNPSFSYRFNTTATPIMWSKVAGFGLHAQSIKYFDSTIAIKHVNGNMDPEASVELSVFRLEVFNYARVNLTVLQNYVTQQIGDQKQSILNKINNMKTKLQNAVNIQVEPFASWTPENASTFRDWVRDLPEYDDSKELELSELTVSLHHHISATNEEGIRTLHAQVSLLEVFEKKLSELYGTCHAAPLDFMQEQERQLIQKQAAVLELSKEAFPEGVDPLHQATLVSAAANIIDYSTATANTSTCPLCHQQINLQAEKLFKTYHTYLTSSLQAEIKAISSILQASKNYDVIRNFEIGDFSAFQTTLPLGFFDALMSSISTLKNALPLQITNLSTGNADAFKTFSQLEQFIQTVNQKRFEITEIVKKATAEKMTFEAEIKRIQEAIATLNAHKIVHINREELLEISQEAVVFSPFANRVARIDFSNLLRQLTNKGKEAYNDLVLGTFEQRLTEEYRTLCGMTLAQMGVRLASKASQQEVTITPQIGDNPVHRVLSEGEQKIHSLAVFMCEATAHPHQILVFDDPVTSFDYNYISNFCERLRNLVRAQPQTQIIVLTHNWDFFVNLQSTLKRSGLNNSLSVQILEDCSVVDEYKEKWDELSQDIEVIVNATNEPTPDEKERVSGLMRRLIERLTNAYVFNEQRHQYKIKALQISDFHSFTKVVPLLPQEADRLRDLYAYLSPLEHDDVRNFYSTKTRVQFQTWYSEIIAIKNAVESRKPA